MKSAFFVLTFAHCFCFLSLYIKTVILISTDYKEENNFGKELLTLFFKTKGICADLFANPMSKFIRQISPCVPYAFGGFTFCHLKLFRICQMKHIILFFYQYKINVTVRRC